MGVSVLDIRCWINATGTVTFTKTSIVVQIKRSFSLTDCEGNVMRVRYNLTYTLYHMRSECSGSANNELNVVTCVGLMCARNFKPCSGLFCPYKANVPQA